MSYLFYQIHNLVIASSFHLPELITIEPRREDIFIAEGMVPKTLKKVDGVKCGVVFANFINYELLDNCLLLTIENVGRFLIKDAHSITFERFEGVEDDTIRLYLLGTCLGILLIWRGVFPFHGSTIHTEYGAAMFIGESGEGKSTLAAKFFREGHDVLTDDVCVVRLKENSAVWAYPSVRRIKLWEDSIFTLGYEDSNCVSIMPNWDKKQLSLPTEVTQNPKQLTVIYKLSPDKNNQLKIETLYGHEKLMTLMENTFRLMGVELFNKQNEHFKFCSSVAQALPVKLLKRPVDSFDIDDLYYLIMDDLKTISLERGNSLLI